MGLAELKQVAARGAKRSLYLVAPVLLWLFALMLGMMEPQVWQPIAMILGVVLFLFGLPLSIVLRIDLMEQHLGIVGPIPQLVAACAVVTANFVLWTTVRQLWRSFLGSEELETEDEEFAVEDEPTARSTIFKKKESDTRLN